MEISTSACVLHRGEDTKVYGNAGKNVSSVDSSLDGRIDWRVLLPARRHNQAGLTPCGDRARNNEIG